MKDFKQDLFDYLKTDRSLSQREKERELHLLFEKHTKLESFQITKIQFDSIVSTAAKKYATESFDIRLDGGRLDSSRVTHYFLLESFIEFLNQQGVLKSVPKLKRQE